MQSNCQSVHSIYHVDTLLNDTTNIFTITNTDWTHHQEWNSCSLKTGCVKRGYSNERRSNTNNFPFPAILHFGANVKLVQRVYSLRRSTDGHEWISDDRSQVNGDVDTANRDDDDDDDDGASSPTTPGPLLTRTKRMSPRTEQLAAMVCLHIDRWERMEQV